jgi:hypothetical protein
MSTEKKLEARSDIDDADIPWIIERAQELQDKARIDEGVSIDEIKAVSRELEIEDVHVEAALVELQQARVEQAQPEPEPEAQPELLDLPTRRRMAERGIMAGGVLLMGIILLGAAALFFPSKDPPENPTEAGSQEDEDRSTTSSRTDVEPESDPEAASKPNTGQKTLGYSEPAPENNPDPHSVDLSEDPTNTPAPAPAQEPPSAEILQDGLDPRLVGNWVLHSYTVQQGGTWMEVPLGRETVFEERERWEFSADDRFRHTMGPSLWFSGRTASSPPGFSTDDLSFWAGPWFLLNGSGVLTSFGQTRAHDYHLGTFQGEEMVLFYLGTDLQKTQKPSQGHIFRRE